MAKQNAAAGAHEKRELGSRLWLEYYNRTLFEKGLISERERNKMALRISGWQGPSV